jgi:hypothetical protein
MTLKEQLLQEIDQASDSLLENLLHLCRQMKADQKVSSHSDDRHSAERIAAQRVLCYDFKPRYERRSQRGDRWLMS